MKATARARSFTVFSALVFLAAGTAFGMTALQKAVHKGDIKKVRELLDKGVDVNQWYYGTALMTAAGENRLEIAKLLIERGADLNAQANVGYTALGLAAVEGYGDMVDLLIVRGADVDRAVAGLQKWAQWAAGPPYPNAKQAAKISNGIGVVQSRAGMAYYSSGQYEKAAAAFQKNAQADPRNPENFAGLAFSLVALKKYGEAKAAAENAVKLAPDRSGGHLALSDAIAGDGHFAEAVEVLKKAVELDPKNPWVWNRLGNAFYSLDDYAEAAANFRQASELALGEPTPLRNLMNTCARSGDLDGGIAAAGELLEKAAPQDSVELLGLRSFLYREKCLPDEAARDAEKAVSIEPGHDWSLFASGVVAMDRGDYDEAVRRLSSVKNEGFILAFVLEAVAYARKGDMEQSEKVFGRFGAGTVSSTNKLVSRNARIAVDLLGPVAKAHLEKAGSLETAGSYREALGEYTLALKIVDEAGAKDIRGRAGALLATRPELVELPEEARKYSMRVEVLVGEKKFDEALKEYQAVLDRAPFYPQAYYNMAVLSANVGKFSQAVGFMNSYLELYPGAQNVREAKDLIYKWEFMVERGADKK